MCYGVSGGVNDGVKRRMVVGVKQNVGKSQNYPWFYSPLMWLLMAHRRLWLMVIELF
jgi:hypothetical protein